MRFVVNCVLGVAVAAGLVGCSRPDPHEKLLEEQTAVLKEALPLFRGVQDKASAAAAAPKLTELHRRFVELREQQKALGPSEVVKKKAYKAFLAAGLAVFQEWMRLGFTDPATGKFGTGVAGAEGIVKEWEDTMAALKEPLENSK
jgi:hypothetical protein